MSKRKSHRLVISLDNRILKEVRFSVTKDATGMQKMEAMGAALGMCSRLTQAHVSAIIAVGGKCSVHTGTSERDFIRLIELLKHL